MPSQQPQPALDKAFFLCNCWENAALRTGPVPATHSHTRVQRMGVITVDRINSNGQKAAATMQLGCWEHSEPPHNNQIDGIGSSWSLSQRRITEPCAVQDGVEECLLHRPKANSTLSHTISALSTQTVRNSQEEAVR